MAELRSFSRSPTDAGFVLGRKLDSIPFSAYHVVILAVLSLVGFVEGYDLSLTSSLLVLAKAPLHLTGSTSAGSLPARPSCCASVASRSRR